jgi:predicted branched-subunit amino acid permease
LTPPNEAGLPSLLSSHATRDGAVDALGVPAAVLGAGFIGFGALAAESGLSLVPALLSTLTIWALPGQLVLAEMHHAGAAAAAIVLAVMLTNARFLPMTLSLMPLLHGSGRRRAVIYLSAHLITLTGWAAAMRRCPSLPHAQRLPYFIGFSLTCWLTATACTLAGYWAAAVLPGLLKQAFVFLNPLYFLLILSGDVRERPWLLALGAGAVAGPILYLAIPKWSILLSGAVGGTVAFFAHLLWRRLD